MSASGMTYLTLFFSFFCFIVSTYGPFFQLFHFWAIFLVKFVENVIQSGGESEVSGPFVWQSTSLSVTLSFHCNHLNFVKKLKGLVQR